jgi:hypothetical protein
VNEYLFRLVAVALAAALLAAPYWQQIQAITYRAVEAVRSQAGLVGRIVAAGLLIAAAWGKVPLPTLPSVAPQVSVATPSDEMQRLVTPVAAALKGLPAADRSLWAALWTRAGVVAAGDAVTAQVAFADTQALRDFTALAVDIGWRRIGRHAAGSQESLRAAVEAAYGSALGKDVVPVTSELRGRYVEFANAVAWAAR